VVLETNDGIQLSLARGLLEEADIPFYVLGQIATLVQSVDASLHKWVRVQVPCDREAEARELLEECSRKMATGSPARAPNPVRAPAHPASAELRGNRVRIDGRASLEDVAPQQNTTIKWKKRNTAQPYAASGRRCEEHGLAEDG